MVCASLFSALFLPRPPSMHCAFFATRPVMNTVAKCMLRPVLVWSSLSIYSSLELYFIHCPLQLYFLCVRKGFVKDACHTINLYAVSISRMCCPCRSFRALFIQRKSRSLPNSIEATHPHYFLAVKLVRFSAIMKYINFSSFPSPSPSCVCQGTRFYPPLATYRRSTCVLQHARSCLPWRGLPMPIQMMKVMTLIL